MLVGLELVMPKNLAVFSLVIASLTDFCIEKTLASDFNMLSLELYKSRVSIKSILFDSTNSINHLPDNRVNV